MRYTTLFYVWSMSIREEDFVSFICETCLNQTQHDFANPNSEPEDRQRNRILKQTTLGFYSDSISGSGLSA